MDANQSISSTLEFQKAYEDVKDKRLVATSIRLSGIERTRPEILARELAPLREARSLDEIKDVLLEVHENLMSLEVFEAVEIIIGDSDTVRNASLILVKSVCEIRSFTGSCIEQWRSNCACARSQLKTACLGPDMATCMQGRQDTCSVLVNCAEKGRARLQTGTYVNGTEGNKTPLYLLSRVLTMICNMPCINELHHCDAKTTPCVYQWMPL